MYVGEWSYLERHPDVKQKEHWYWNTIKSLKDSSFESALSRHPAYPFFIQNVDRVTLHDSFKGSHDEPEFDESLLHCKALNFTTFEEEAT